MSTIEEPSSENVLHTSTEGWIEKALAHYKEKRRFIIVDDAQLGLSADEVSSGIRLIAAMKRKGHINWKHLATIATGLGISGVGLWLLWLAWIDPEPWSKLGVLVVAGAILVFGGGVSILVALNARWHVKVGAMGTSFEINPGKSDAKGD